MAIPRSQRKQSLKKKGPAAEGVALKITKSMNDLTPPENDVMNCTRTGKPIDVKHKTIDPIIETIALKQQYHGFTWDTMDLQTKTMDFCKTLDL